VEPDPSGSRRGTTTTVTSVAGAPPARWSPSISCRRTPRAARPGDPSRTASRP